MIEYRKAEIADAKLLIDIYTERCGFNIQSSEMDGNARVFRFVLER